MFMVDHRHTTIRVVGWPDSNWQIDEKFVKQFSQLEMRTSVFVGKVTCVSKKLLTDELAAQYFDVAGFRPLTISRLRDLGDSIMTAIVIAPLIKQKTTFTDLGRLRLQETERVVALRTELTKCGAKVIEEGDTLTVYPSQLHGAEIETYNDHRVAMCFAILGLKVPGIKLKNPSCVKKTFPNFFQKLATPPPHGLGVTILDAKTGRKLEMAELFAE